MIIKNNSLLNILIPNENKVLKEVLKEADLQSAQNNKSTNVQDVLKNLMQNVTSQTKSHETIQNLLKNSSVFKELGNFSKELESLIKNVPNDEKLMTVKNTLNSFLTHIKDLDENKLKELVQKSGIFLESKIANSTQPSNENKINALLLQIKELTKQETSTEAKKLNTLIDKMLTQNQDTKSSNHSPQDLKQIIQVLKNIVEQVTSPNQSKIVHLTQQLENLNQNIKLADSKIQQNILPQEQKNSLQNELKPLLSELKNNLIQSKQAVFEPIIKQLDALLQSKDVFSKQMQSIEPKALLQQIVQSPQLEKMAQEIPSVKTLLSALTQQLQQLHSTQNSIDKADISTQKIQNLQNDIKTTLTQLQTIMSETKDIQLQPLQKSIQTLMNMPNLFSKLEHTPLTQNTISTLQNSATNEFKPLLNNLSENIKSIITAIKSTILQLQSNNELQLSNKMNPFELQKNVQKLETLVQNSFEPLSHSLKQNTKSAQNILQEDIKSALLQLQTQTENNPKAQELSKQVERLLTHIDYYQLLSVTSNSNYLYVPFIWDMLEEGSISMKQLQEERFFCEIHLTLKEFGKMDVLLGLYEENNIDISIFSNEPFVKELINENISQLKIGLNKAGLIPQTITLLDLKPEDDNETKATYTSNPYANSDMGFGVNIKV